MGIISSFITRKTERAADKIAKLYSLCSQQLSEVQKKREEYLSEIPNPNAKQSIEMLQKYLATAGVEIYNAYLPLISKIYTPLDIKTEYTQGFKSKFNICYVNITKWVVDVNENSLEKLINIYEVLSNNECNIGLIFHREHSRTEVYLSVTNLKNTANLSDVNSLMDRLISAINGNFPGSEFFVVDDKKESPKKYKSYGVLPCLDKIEQCSVASITNIPTEKSEKFVSQTIEKLLDGIIPSPDGNSDYTIILLATPIFDIDERKIHLAEIYSKLAPYAEWQKNFSYSDSYANNSMAIVGVNTGASLGINMGANLGINFGANFARASNITLSVAKNEGITQQFTNYNIKHALQKIEMQMKRLETSSALGFWDFGAYVISKDPNTTNNVAHTYLALTQGEESYMSQPSINFWRGDLGDDNTESLTAKEICSYLRELRHPIFALDKVVVDKQPELMVYPPIVTATTGLSGKELAYSLNFPRKSIAGLPVIECAEFGRNVSTFDISPKDRENIKLGKIFHMHHEEASNLELSKDSLASHTFITGSTGSGKSNTVYKILDECTEKSVKFLVIEPAKGEYQNVFGNRKDVQVYGTNKQFADLLRINPFSFPSEIHILEHLDRLVEIFNVCWPMYAAMPAVLKEAVEKSYEDCGWNLTESTNKYRNDLYPTFADVTRNIRTIIDTSEYDAENKGAYKGSLITRLKSLTNGINGLIFSTDEISNEKLFDENVIIDLSRVGSSETKSLIMGLLVLKLQEYRMTKGEMSAPLKHITVLEEAHNLLKRTNTGQSQEFGNLLGKSVEMLTNAIAEMRTYGEGFIIADQAPGLLDLAVIRNTNTKIIMRLPDLDDRELVGKAAALNDRQIEELAKLPCGVAAVYQNEWVQSVLCKVDKFETEGKYHYNPNQSETQNTLEDRISMARELCQLANDSEKVKEMLDNAMQAKALFRFSGSLYAASIQYLDSTKSKPDYDKLSFIVSSLLPEFTKTLKDSALNNPSDVSIWRNDLQEHIELALNECNMQEDRNLRNNILQCVLQNYILTELNKRHLLNELINPKAQ